MIIISREQFPYAAYLRVIGIRRDADESSDSTWATLDDLGTVTRVGTDTAIVKNNHDVLVFRKDGTIRLDSNGHPADREGRGIITDCSVRCAKQEDGTYLGENGDIYTKDNDFPGTCTDQNGNTFYWTEDVEENIRVWIIYYDNMLMRNLLTFDVSYAETVNTYENESGQTITYPIRIGKRKIDLKIETDLQGLIMLKDYFSQPECFFFYRSTTDIEEQHGTFRKTSDVQIQTIANESNFRNSHLFDDASFFCDVNSEYGNYLQRLYEFYKGNYYHTGAYEFSVSLEEV